MKETVSRNEKIAPSLGFHKAVMKIIKRSIEFLVQRSFFWEENVLLHPSTNELRSTFQKNSKMTRGELNNKFMGIHDAVYIFPLHRWICRCCFSHKACESFRRVKDRDGRWGSSPISRFAVGIFGFQNFSAFCKSCLVITAIRTHVIKLGLMTFKRAHKASQNHGDMNLQVYLRSNCRETPTGCKESCKSWTSSRPMSCCVRVRYVKRKWK